MQSERLMILDQPQPSMSGPSGMLSSPQRAGNVLSNLARAGRYMESGRIAASFTDSWTHNLAGCLVETGDLSPLDSNVRALQDFGLTSPRSLAEAAHTFERHAGSAAVADMAVARMQRLTRAPLQHAPFVGQLWAANTYLDAGKLVDARDMWLQGGGRGLVTTVSYLGTPTDPGSMPLRSERVIERASERLGRPLSGWERFALDALVLGKMMPVPDPMAGGVSPKRLVLVCWGHEVSTSQVGELAESMAKVWGIESYLGVHMRGGDPFLGFVSNRATAARLWLYLGYESMSVMTSLAEGAIEMIKERVLPRNAGSGDQPTAAANN